MAFDREHAEGMLLEVLDPARDGLVIGLAFRLLDGVVATACRCLPRAGGKLVLPDPDEAGGEPVLLRLRRPGTDRIATAAVIAADPGADYALLAAAPAAAGPGALEALLAGRTTARLAFEPVEQGRSFVCTHEWRWVEGTIRGTALSVWTPSDRIRSATSGAPVFDQEGRVLGLVGHNDVRLPDATICVLADQLPGWALAAARQAEAVRAGAAAQPVV